MQQKGCASFSDFFVDGVKPEADADRDIHLWEKNMLVYHAVVQYRVKQLLGDIDKINTDEDEKMRRC